MGGSIVVDKKGIWSGLINYVYRSAQQLRSQPGEGTLRLGLAAISIENCSSDYRDTLVALAELYVAAEEAGIDPKPYFKEVAELSSGEVPRGGMTPVREMLGDFHNYAVLRERRSKRGQWVDDLAPWERRVTGPAGSSGDRQKDNDEKKRASWWRRLFGSRE